MSMRGEPEQDRVLQYVKDYWPEDQTLWQFLMNSLAAIDYRPADLGNTLPGNIKDTDLMRGMHEYFLLRKRF